MKDLAKLVLLLAILGVGFVSLVRFLGCKPTADMLSVGGGPDEAGAKAWIGGKYLGRLIAKGGTDTSAVCSGDWSVPLGRQPIVVVSVKGETLRSEGVIGDYTSVDVSFARKSIRVKAQYDVPRADPNDSTASTVDRSGP